MSPDEYEEYAQAIQVWRSFYGNKTVSVEELLEFYKSQHNKL